MINFEFVDKETSVMSSPQVLIRGNWYQVEKITEDEVIVTDEDGEEYSFDASEIEDYTG